MTNESAVAAGAEWLDENRPGWEGSIDLGALDMQNGCRCILGQLDGPNGCYGEFIILNLPDLGGWQERVPRVSIYTERAEAAS